MHQDAVSSDLTSSIFPVLQFPDLVVFPTFLFCICLASSCSPLDHSLCLKNCFTFVKNWLPNFFYRFPRSIKNTYCTVISHHSINLHVQTAKCLIYTFCVLSRNRTVMHFTVWTSAATGETRKNLESMNQRQLPASLLLLLLSIKSALYTVKKKHYNRQRLTLCDETSL